MDLILMINCDKLFKNKIVCHYQINLLKNRLCNHESLFLTRGDLVLM